MARTSFEKWMHEYRVFTSQNPERKERFETRSGIPLKPLYTSADLDNFDEEQDLGFPGQYPYTRGIYHSMYRGRLWTRRMLIGLQTAEIFNRRQKEMLQAGQTGINYLACNATYRGYDSDMVEKELLGRCGTITDSIYDLERAFEGIPLDQVTTNINDSGPFALVAMYIALAQKQGIPLSQLQGTTGQSDFLENFTHSNLWFRFSLEGHLRMLVDHIKYCTEFMPRWHPVSVKENEQEAGGNKVQEVAFTLSRAILYINESLKAGLKVDDFAPRLSFLFHSSTELFEEVAKFRALRRMYAKIMRERFGARDPRSWQLRFFVQTLSSELARQQILNNITRVCIQALGAVLGGAQAIHTDSYDEAWWSPSERAHRVALMTQNIIAEETGIADVIDPLGGSYYVESLTNEIEKRAWEYIKRIDDIGGMLEAARSGYPQRETARAAVQYQREVERGERVVVGVNKYNVPEGEPPAEQLKVDPKVVKEQVERTKRLKRERDQRRAAAALAELKRVARGDGNLFGAVIEAVKADVTNGEIVRELREVFGFGRPLEIMAIIP